MSHFTMLVAGEDYNYQLAPFHKYECDGNRDEFVVDVDETEEYKKRFEEAKEKFKTLLEAYENHELTQEEFAERTKYSFKGDDFFTYLTEYSDDFKYAGTEKPAMDDTDYEWGYVYKDENGDLRVIRRTNPDSKWDWYVEGGRWGGILKLKDGTSADSARKGDIDFEKMWADELERLQKRYRKVIKVLGGIPHLEHTWESLWEDKTLSLEERRDVYDAQPAVKKFKKSKEIEEAVGWMGSVDDFICTEEEYVEKHSPYSLTFGFVVNREWHEKAEMGWWAATSNEKEPTSWNREYKDFIDSLPDDTLLTVVDCHI